MNRKISSEKSILEMERELIEISSLIKEANSRMIEINNNYQDSNGGLNSEILQEEFELQVMIIDNLMQKKAEIELTSMVKMAKDIMKSNNSPEILRLTSVPYKIDRIYLGVLILVFIGVILSLLLR